MREIKFRILLNGEFYYWGFLRDEVTGSLFFNGIPSCNESMAYKLEHSQQYSGLKDKSGKEIYEGDIVTGFPSGFHPLLVTYTKCAFYAGRNGETYFELFNKDFSWEVIGNIYETPEILEVRNDTL